MVSLLNVQRLGTNLIAYFSDDTNITLYDTGSGTWIAPAQEAGGGTGTAPTGSEPVPASGSTIYNPWANYSISGTWQDHMSYSAGGIDYPLAYGTALKAPAAGTLHTTGGTGEFRAGWVGSAGRRSVLYLDNPITRPAGRPLEENEGTGALYAIVLQHQSAFGTDGAHYNLGAVCGSSGASADGDDYGGDTHLHVHGLNSSGQRLDFLNFLP